MPICDSVNDYWEGWDQRGNRPVEYDVEDGGMREKTRMYRERKSVHDKLESRLKDMKSKYIE